MRQWHLLESPTDATRYMCRICLLVHGLLVVMTFAVRFSTVHVDLVVYASTEVALGGSHPHKGQRKCDDSPYLRLEFKAGVLSSGPRIARRLRCPKSPSRGQQQLGKCPLREGSQGLPPVWIQLGRCLYSKLRTSSPPEPPVRPPLTACYSSSVGAESCFSRTFHI